MVFRNKKSAGFFTFEDQPSTLIKSLQLASGKHTGGSTGHFYFLHFLVPGFLMQVVETDLQIVFFETHR